MKLALNHDQEEAQRAFRAFAEMHVAPYAAEHDASASIPPAHIRPLADAGFLGAALPPAQGGGGMDPITYGILHLELGRACAAVQGLVNVQHMAAQSILKWSTPALRDHWGPKLAAGEAVAAFALTEPNVGSDVKSVETTATEADGCWVLNGRKRWISFAQIADVAVVLARCDGAPAAFLVPRDNVGLTVTPISGLIGCRGYMLAELELDACRVPCANLLGRVGFGVSHVAATGLETGRFAVAWGCVGMAQACLDACLAYTRSRRQFGAPLRDHQLVQRMVSRMATDLQAAALLAWHAGHLLASRDPEALMAVSMAKYFASTVLRRIARDALQIHGANGCGSDFPLQRILRDAAVMEIIEGTSQMQELIIARLAYGRPAAAVSPTLSSPTLAAPSPTPAQAHGT
jgi:hypothetical protein